MATRTKKKDEPKEQQENKSTIEAAIVPTKTQNDIDDELRLMDIVDRRERSLIDTLSASSRAIDVFRTRAELLSTARMVAIGETNPQDWVLQRTREDEISGRPNSVACNKIAEVYGIQVENVRPLGPQGQFAPEQIEEPDGSITMRCWCDGFSHATGRRIWAVEASRNSKEQFIGRGTINDLRASTWTALTSKVARVLSGTSKVPHGTLAEAWKKYTHKDVEHCVKGPGFGSSTERGAARVASNEAKSAAEKLWTECLKVAGGDTDEAKGLLKTMTSFKKRDGGTFPGYEDYKRITSDKMANIALDNLRKKYADVLN